MALEITRLSDERPEWSTKKCIIVAIISLIIGLSIFTIAYISMHKHIYLDQYNQSILTWMVEHRKAQITAIVGFITSLAGSVYLGGIVSAIAIIWAIIKREVWRPFLLIGAVGATTIVSSVIKSIIKNARPEQISMVKPFELDYSFPSGHVLAITVFILVFGYLIISRRSSDFRITVWFILTAFLITLIAFTRLYLGYHWLTDATASVGVGFIMLALVIFVDRFFVQMFKN